MMMSSKSSALAAASRRWYSAYAAALLLLDLGLGARRRGLVVDQLVLVGRDPAHHRPDRELLRVQLQVVQHQLHQPLGVGVVVDGEGPREPEPVDLTAQDPHAGGVEGGDPHQLGAVADQLGHPVPHLGGGLVREGDGQHRARVDLALAHQVRDPAGQHPGLARAGAGHHQHRGALVQHGLTLRRVETREQVDLRRSGGSGGLRRGCMAAPRFGRPLSASGLNRASQASSSVVGGRPWADRAVVRLSSRHHPRRHRPTPKIDCMGWRRIKVGTMLKHAVLAVAAVQGATLLALMAIDQRRKRSRLRRRVPAGAAPLGHRRRVGGDRLHLRRGPLLRHARRDPAGQVGGLLRDLHLEGRRDRAVLQAGADRRRRPGGPGLRRVRRLRQPRRAPRPSSTCRRRSRSAGTR